MEIRKKKKKFQNEIKLEKSQKWKLLKIPENFK